ncbi:hypothetical protein [Actinomadura litoris]|uniref:hypothetical protein n=1 Tax=Actinomadura litoris TaxID=2678616 RepID=UPI001FA775A5|nr:hypothetical protein [Actinomadura litoris]
MAGRRLLSVEGADQLRAVSRDLRKHGQGTAVRRRMVGELKKGANDLVRAERAAVLALPSKGQNARRGRRSLRRSVATATVSTVRTVAKDPRVSVRIDPSRMPEGQANLPAYMNAERRFERWRHPVFGTRKYVTQRATPWFYATARPLEESLQRRMVDVISGVAQEIERG